MLNFKCLQLREKNILLYPLCNVLPANRRLAMFVTLLQLCYNAQQGGTWGRKKALGTQL